jgi:hypothetical protein
MISLVSSPLRAIESLCGPTYLSAVNIQEAIDHDTTDFLRSVRSHRHCNFADVGLRHRPCVNRSVVANGVAMPIEMGRRGK